jgi:hypothetical protein
MALDASLIAMVESLQENINQDPAPPLMTEDTDRGAARLSDLMTVDDGVTGTAVVTPPARIEAVVPPDTGTLGDAILGKLDNLSSHYQDAVKHAHDALDGTRSPGLHDMLRLQFNMTVVTMEIDVLGKGVSKVVQTLDQLTKLQ